MDLITTGEAAAILGVNRSTIHDMVTRGDLTPDATAHGYYLWDRDGIVRLRDDRERAPAA